MQAGWSSQRGKPDGRVPIVAGGGGGWTPLLSSGEGTKGNGASWWRVALKKRGQKENKEEKEGRRGLKTSRRGTKGKGGGTPSGSGPQA
jgi:hypothetical protein